MALTEEADLGSATPLRLSDVLTGRQYDIRPRRLIVAGFTGRSRSAVEEHLDELRRLGAAVPSATPMFYDLPPSLLTASGRIVVQGTFTSGEVEAVAVHAGHWLLCVGSDHTDRHLERTSIRRSKEVCAKVLGGNCVRLDAIADWDVVELRSWLADEQHPYQAGNLGDLLPFPTIVQHASGTVGELGPGDVLFLGTIPVRDGELRPSPRFRAELRAKELERPLSISYDIELEEAGDPG